MMKSKTSWQAGKDLTEIEEVELNHLRKWWSGRLAFVS